MAWVALLLASGVFLASAAICLTRMARVWMRRPTAPPGALHAALRADGFYASPWFAAFWASGVAVILSALALP